MAVFRLLGGLFLSYEKGSTNVTGCEMGLELGRLLDLRRLRGLLDNAERYWLADGIRGVRGVGEAHARV